MGTYAADTSVSVEKSRAEIERTLQRWNAEQFMYGWNKDGAVVGFVMNNRQLRFVLAMPDRTAKQFWYTPSRGTKRTEAQAYAEWEQACRQRWRALNLVIKAKLEAVESGISTFDNEFLAQIMLPNGRTIGEEVHESLEFAYENNQMPALLPEFRKAIES
jgi:hypothetical protein